MEQVDCALQSASNNSKQEKETIAPLFSTFYLRLKDLNSLVKRNLQYLNTDQEAKKVITPVPFVSFGVPEI